MAFVQVQSPSALCISVGGGAAVRGFVEPWVDPLAGLTMQIRLQTHRGDGVPLGMYQDVECTVPARVDGDPVAAWRDELSGSGYVAYQATGTKRGTLRFSGGVPYIAGDATDDGYVIESGPESPCTLAMPYVLAISVAVPPSSFPGARVVGSATMNYLIHPRRGSSGYFFGSSVANVNTDADQWAVCSMECVDTVDIVARRDGGDITEEPVTSGDWPNLCLGAESLYPEAMNCHLVAVIACLPEDRVTVETYMESLQP